VVSILRDGHFVASSEGEKQSSTSICQGRFAVIRWH
jgi:hypothetical protein